MGTQKRELGLHTTIGVNTLQRKGVCLHRDQLTRLKDRREVLRHRVERIEQGTHSDAIIRVVMSSSMLRVLLKDHSAGFVDYVYRVDHGSLQRGE